MIYCFDLDDTICYPNHNETDTFEKYGKALPNHKMIAVINELHETNKIIIHTARRMLTHSGNLDMIMKDVGKITEDWLEENGVKYDEIIFGKPYADFYIDDKAINSTDIEINFPQYKDI